jgi:hypothetical protein
MSKFSGKGGLTNDNCLVVWDSVWKPKCFGGATSAQFENDEHVQYSMPGGAGLLAGTQVRERHWQVLGVTVSPQTEDLFCVKSKKKKDLFCAASHMLYYHWKWPNDFLLERPTSGARLVH